MVLIIFSTNFLIPWTSIIASCSSTLTMANTCIPPGLVDYFISEDRPTAWEKPKCAGRAGAVGGYNPQKNPCGGAVFPEEYLECVDVRVVAGWNHRKGKNARKQRPKTFKPHRPVQAVDLPALVSRPSPLPVPVPSWSSTPSPLSSASAPK